MKPLITQYEYCLIFAEKHEAKGNFSLARAYRKLMAEMTVAKAEAWI